MARCASELSDAVHDCRHDDDAVRPPPVADVVADLSSFSRDLSQFCFVGKALMFIDELPQKGCGQAFLESIFQVQDASLSPYQRS